MTCHVLLVLLQMCALPTQVRSDCPPRQLVEFLVSDKGVMADQVGGRAGCHSQLQWWLLITGTAAAAAAVHCRLVLPWWLSQGHDELHALVVKMSVPTDPVASPSAAMLVLCCAVSL